MKTILVALCAASLLVSCADPAAPPARVYDDGDYVTGSNLPRRSRMPPEAQTVSREVVEDWQRSRTAPKPIGGGGF